MRITNAQINAIMNSSLGHNAAATGKLMQQMATGKRIIVPSDDPIASVRLLRIAREEASLNQYQHNIDSLKGRLSAAETNLQAGSDTLLEMRDLLLWAANRGANSDDDLGSMASELDTLKETFVSYLNVRDEEGRYYFSGTKTDQRAVTLAAGAYTLTGNDKPREVAVANGVLIKDNVTATDVLAGAPGFLNQLNVLVDLMLNNPASITTHIGDAIGSLDKVLASLSGQITELGGRQNTLSLLKDSQADVSLVNQKIEGELSSLDYAEASLDLSNYQVALQATQKSYLKLHSLNLFDLM
ncbi:MAG TPA: flagellar hook-associated protein FlgL [Pseudomonas sp.]|uniref:flagellar hook-associated protein FlgL n=1 Tax=Pseudomonas sp. TaxID=306 RepID=UPI002B952861|nr:flagellar hook-associated protein FlgL [Pseudomonas sp.]HTO19859.1 flagellar hook-associated protein FlgL [Pseudomonas sp.]